jgi:hydroxyacid-oxoacid transhydrogenase
MYCRHRRLIILSPLRRAIGRSCFSTLENNADPICELASSTLRYGPTSTSEVGQDLAYMNAKRILLFVDPYIATMDPFHNVVSSIEKHVPAGHFLDIYDKIRVEPNNESFKHAIEFMSEKTRNHGPYDAVIALGGGSTIDTAKAANLYTCYPPDDFYDYVNPPLGKGLPVPGPIVPLIAIPSTSGTGSETTGVAIFDDVPTKSKTGIAHRRLKPTLGIVDPDNTKTMSPPVAKYSGIDVLCHAIESYTAIPYTSRASGRPISPILRPAYQGSNPISDIWALHALRECSHFLPRIVNNPLEDSEARAKMCLAASTAGMGFGNAGVHLCHGMSYAVASQVKKYWVEGYPQLNDVADVGNDHGLVPHGLSVVINAPSVFKFTGSNLDENDPIQKRSVDRHVECAIILANARLQRRGDSVTIGQEVTSEKAMRDKPGDALANELLELMHDLEIPIGLRSLGYSETDVEELAKGTLPQHRVTKLSPRQPVELEELTALFKDAL